MTVCLPAILVHLPRQLLFISNPEAELPSMGTADGAQWAERLRKHLPVCCSAQSSI